MGHSVNRASKEKIPINLTQEEVKLYINRFEIIDKDRKGYVSVNDIRRSLKVQSKILISLFSDLCICIFVTVFLYNFL